MSNKDSKISAKQMKRPVFGFVIGLLGALLCLIAGVILAANALLGLIDRHHKPELSWEGVGALLGILLCVGGFRLGVWLLRKSDQF